MSAQPLPARRRLFFALWPGEALRRSIAARLQPAVGAGQPVAPEDLHVTLEFLGEVAESRRATLEEIGAGFALPAGELVLDHLEWWRTPALVVARPGAAPAALLALQSALRAVLAAEGFRVDARPYLPHATLARRVAARPELGSIEPLAWPLERFALVESGRHGTAHYHALASWTR